MRLVVSTPTGLVVDADAVFQVRAEDPTGAFGIRPGHAPFLTVLTISVVSWQDGSGSEHYVAVRKGVLSVSDDGTVSIATMEARAGDSLAQLRSEILEYFRRSDLEEEEMRRSANRLHAATIRQLQRVLEAARRPSEPRKVPGFGRGPAPVRESGRDERTF